jgi:PBP1b-binding outer membrane lipoprotein LpoB
MMTKKTVGVLIFSVFLIGSCSNEPQTPKNVAPQKTEVAQEEEWLQIEFLAPITRVNSETGDEENAIGFRYLGGNYTITVAPEAVKCFRKKNLKNVSVLVDYGKNGKGEITTVKGCEATKPSSITLPKGYKSRLG